MTDMRNLVQYVTFGRTSTIVAEVLMATIPVIFALLLQERVIFFIEYDSQQLLSLAFISILFVGLIDYTLLAKAGSNTYSPALHTPRYIVVATISQILISAIIVYIGYLLLVFPQVGSVLPSTDDLYAGIILTMLYSVLLVGAHASSTISYSIKSEKEHLYDFLSGCERLQSSTSEAVNTDVESIEDAGFEVLKNLKNEPMRDTSELENELRRWLDSFTEYQIGGKQKMVGANVADPEELSPPWNDLYEQYQSIHKRLSVMESTALDVFRDARCNND